MRTEIRESHSTGYDPSVLKQIEVNSKSPNHSLVLENRESLPFWGRFRGGLRIVKYVLQDILRNKIVLAYTAFLLVVSISMFNLGGGGAKGILSLLNIMLIVVPLVSVVFSTIHFYNSYEFIELLVAQPVPRSRIFLSQYIGLSGALTVALLIGVGIPTVLFDGSILGFTMLAVGIGLTLIFTSLALLASVLARDKAKGIGFALLLWFYFSLIYDGLVLLLMFSFSDYPLEKFMWLFTALNPVDLARITILLQMDVAALMGFTGATYKAFFGSSMGILFSVFVMFVWMIVPLWLGLRVFKRKDL
jgi:Cu-processing system permease protein